jgi:hypothetical protein
VGEELRRLGGGRERVEIGPRDVLRADERADVGDEGEILAVEEAFERIRAGMQGEVVLRVIPAVRGVEMLPLELPLSGPMRVETCEVLLFVVPS